MKGPIVYFIIGRLVVKCRFVVRGRLALRCRPVVSYRLVVITVNLPNP